jgi:hypothetical protein
MGDADALQVACAATCVHDAGKGLRYWFAGLQGVGGLGFPKHIVRRWMGSGFRDTADGWQDKHQCIDGDGSLARGHWQRRETADMDVTGMTAVLVDACVG